MPRFDTNDLVFDPATRRTLMVRVLETSFDQRPPVTIYGCCEYLCAGSLLCPRCQERERKLGTAYCVPCKTIVSREAAEARKAKMMEQAAE